MAVTPRGMMSMIAKVVLVLVKTLGRIIHTRKDFRKTHCCRHNGVAVMGGVCHLLETSSFVIRCAAWVKHPVGSVIFSDSLDPPLRKRPCSTQ